MNYAEYAPRTLCRAILMAVEQPLTLLGDYIRTRHYVSGSIMYEFEHGTVAVDRLTRRGTDQGVSLNFGEDLYMPDYEALNSCLEIACLENT